MCFDTTWVLLGAMALIALVLLHRIYRTANSHDRQMELEYRRTLDLAREETMRLQIMVNACGLGGQGQKISRHKWWPGPPPPPPPETQL